MISHHYISMQETTLETGRFPHGLCKAVENVNNLIAPKLTGMDVRDQKKIDDVMVQDQQKWGEKSNRSKRDIFQHYWNMGGFLVGCVQQYDMGIFFFWA